MTAWTQFVSKVFHEGRKKHGKSYSFKQAMQDASKRKGEMGSMNKSPAPAHAKKTRKGRKGRKGKKGGKTRKH